MLFKAVFLMRKFFYEAKQIFIFEQNAMCNILAGIKKKPAITRAFLMLKRLNPIFRLK
jgi:hypothetical protein